MSLLDVHTTTATKPEADAIARALIEARLAACVQVHAVDSLYRWEGAIDSAQEWALVIKTTAARWAEVEATIRARHRYQLPAIHAVAVAEAAPDYAAWVEACCAPA